MDRVASEDPTDPSVESGDHRHSPPHPPRPRFKVTEATRATAGNVALLRHTLGCWSRWAVHRGPSAIA